MIIEAKHRIGSRATLLHDFGQARSYAMQLEARILMLAAREGIWLWERERERFVFEDAMKTSWREVSEARAVAELARRIGAAVLLDDRHRRRARPST
jgi:hypothetical protein